MEHENLLFSVKQSVYQLNYLKQLPEVDGEMRFTYDVEPAIFIPECIYFTDTYPFNLWNSIDLAMTRFSELEHIIFPPRNLLNKLSLLTQKFDQSTMIEGFNGVVAFKKEWKEQYPFGLALQPTYSIAQSSLTYHTYALDEFSIQSPLVFMPDEFKVRLPISTTGFVSVFFFEIFNPFDYPVSFRVFQNPNPDPNLSVLDPMRSERLRHMAKINTDIDIFSEAFASFGCSVNKRSDVAQTNGQGAYSNSDNVFSNCRDERASTNPYNIFHGVTFIRSQEKASLQSLGVTNDSVQYNPYYTMDSASAEITVDPKRGAYLGPIHFYALENNPESVEEMFYIYNSFYGYDRVRVVASSGTAKLVVNNISFANNTRQVPKQLNSSCWDFGDIVVSDLGEAHNIHIKNIGNVSAVINYVAFNNIICMRGQSAIPPGEFRQDKSFRCDNLPQQINRNKVFDIAVVSPNTCKSIQNNSKMRQKRGYFDQRLACAAPKRLSKYTT